MTRFTWPPPSAGHSAFGRGPGPIHGGGEEQEPLGPLEFVDRLLGRQADARRERTIQRRIRDACFREVQALEAFDWEFNRQTIDRRQIEELATGDFIRRCDNLVLVGQSGVGKSFLMQALGRRACGLGYRVRYITSKACCRTCAACVWPDKSLPQRVRYYARFDWLIIDEFGFDRLERLDSRPATNLLYKIIDARTQRSTSLVTNVDFERHQAEYLDDPPLAMAFLDRVVDDAHHLANPRQIVSRPIAAQKRGPNHAHRIPVGIGVQQADDRPAPTSRRSAKRRNATLAPLLWCITQRTCRLLLAAKLVPFLTATVTSSQPHIFRLPRILSVLGCCLISESASRFKRARFSGP